MEGLGIQPYMFEPVSDEDADFVEQQVAHPHLSMLCPCTELLLFNHAKSEEVLSKFLKEKEDIGNMILQADQSLSEAEQEKEVQRLKNEILEQRQRGLEEQNRLQERVFKDMQRSHKEHTDQTILRMEREQERMRRDNERVLEAKLREKEALLQEGLQKQASQMQKQINSLKSDMQKEEKSKPSTLSRIADGLSATAELILPGFVTKWFR